ncbi:MAG: pantetheine-phosphate adenylyltransferase [Erysipelotrichaceae bacterium]|nr:pantetheine-phosphate adenylyltransferase [Erysipelotrichaceae bacterium]
MKKAIYPGSFDPLTNGHLDIIKRASDVFDKVYVCVADNPMKKYFFTTEERLNMAKESCKDIPNVEVIYTDGVVVNKAHELGCKVIVRGLRAVTDFEFEFQLAAANEFINDEIETMFLMASSGKGFISSSYVKDFYLNNVDISSLVPEPVLKYFKKR